MPAIILLAVWKNFGYATILFVAGLQAIPESLYEAARLDGAGALAAVPQDHAAAARADAALRRRHDDDRLLPVLRRALRHDGGGGPLNATLSVGLLMYKKGFRWWNMGYAAAIAFVLFVVVLGLTAVQFRLQKGREA